MGTCARRNLKVAPAPDLLCGWQILTSWHGSLRGVVIAGADADVLTGRDVHGRWLACFVVAAVTPRGVHIDGEDRRPQ